MTTERTDASVDALRREVAALNLRIGASERRMRQVLTSNADMIDERIASNEKVTADLAAGQHVIAEQQTRSYASFGDQLLALQVRLGRLESVSWSQQGRSTPRRPRR